ncbi:MAG TPA: response regulator [Ktedonobacterales bacterium]
MAHVLIADDDEGIRESLRMLLEDDGHRVTECDTGQDALTILRQEGERCVVLLDLVMPDMDELGLLRAIESDAALARRHAYIVLSAGTESLLSQAQPFVTALGGMVVRKPFDIDELTRAVSLAEQRLRSSAG